jgi:phage terminase large subunit-like protein
MSKSRRSEAASRSMAERFCELPEAEQQLILRSQPPERLEKLPWHWPFWARPAQLPPAGNAWRVWLILAGRGFGKSRAGAEWVRSRAEANAGMRLALVGATYAETRAIMVEGDSGLLAIAPPDNRPSYESSRRRLIWPNGAQALLYSGEDPEALRGPQHHAAWCDELAKWPDPQATWDMLWFGLRLGDAPQAVVTTTPRPVKLLKTLMDAPDTVVTRGATQDNPYLPRAFLTTILERYSGTRLGRQEIGGELIEDVAGALWTRAMLDAGRVSRAPELVRVVVAIDPPVTSGTRADACGIVAAGICARGHAYVLEDASVQGLRPDGWMRAALATYARHDADRLLAETNNGGDLVGDMLRALDPSVAYRKLNARRGKHARAEPVAALYERGLVHHVGAQPALEDQMCAFLPGGHVAGGGSPDRVDALVWALTELLLTRAARPGVRTLI